MSTKTFNPTEFQRITGHGADRTAEIAEHFERTDRERLAAVDPKALAGTDKEIASAERALADALAKRASRRELIAAVESRLLALGRHRELTAAFRAEFALPDAGQVFAAWEIAHTAPSPKTSSAYASLLMGFAAAAAIQPHVESRLAALAAQEKAMADEILETCKAEKIGLPNLLAVMAVEHAPKAGKIMDPDAHRLLTSGVLKDFAKN
jgi:hypothetical protein